MTTTLPRCNELDVPETVFLRPRFPNDRQEFEKVLPWMTPLFVYAMNDKNWVRWSVPRAVGLKIGLPEGCSCCTNSPVVETADDFQIDTAWSETSWWLEANGYALPEALPTENPTEGKQ